MNILSENLRFLRAKRKLSQQKLSNKIGITREAYQKYEEGKSEPSIDVLVKLSNYYQTTIDFLVKVNLTKIKPEDLIELNGRLLFPIHINDDDGDSIELIPDSAKAGYTTGYGDPEYIEKLETMKLPFLQNGKYRAFPIEGDSMAPKVKHGSYVIGKFVENIKSIKDGKTYVILLQNDGILYKRLYWRDSKLKFVSDNKFYDPYIVFPSEIIEVWEFSCAIDMTDDEETEVSNQQLLETLLAMKNKR